MSKDDELDEMMTRAQQLALYLGEYPRNDYLCFVCRELDRREGESTFLDFPHAIQLDTGWPTCLEHSDDPRVTRIAELLVPNPFPFTPHPVPCRNCGQILQATYAADNAFKCPSCLVPCCYVCGCTDLHGCSIELWNQDKTSSQVLTCSWAEVATCTFCAWRAAYEFYQEAIGQAAADPFYMSIGRTVRAVKGLTYGV